MFDRLKSSFVNNPQNSFKAPSKHEAISEEDDKEQDPIIKAVQKSSPIKRWKWGNNVEEEEDKEIDIECDLYNRSMASHSMGCQTSHRPTQFQIYETINIPIQMKMSLRNKP